MTRSCRSENVFAIARVSARRNGFTQPNLERELAALVIDLDLLAGAKLALQQTHGERILNAPLQRALERPRAEVRIVAFLRQRVARRIGEMDLDLPLGEQRLETF